MKGKNSFAVLLKLGLPPVDSELPLLPSRRTPWVF